MRGKCRVAPAGFAGPGHMRNIPSSFRPPGEPLTIATAYTTIGLIPSRKQTVGHCAVALLSCSLCLSSGTVFRCSRASIAEPLRDRLPPRRRPPLALISGPLRLHRLLRGREREWERLSRWVQLLGTHCHLKRRCSLSSLALTGTPLKCCN